ncbi:uncharacterized protein LOC112171063 [Rosa chinensis]|uniref:uncharacterized protein LOC112171063 n=1 Tax=Rosa chinensis TaxID=74649 RepID=UPI000D08E424|nr:uncharacterized protein LOC112171063 [Rosa chinensis]
MVPKKSPGSWRMCVDYTNLNRACPKDSFPLPRIDQLIDSTAGYWLLSFMDAFSRYNQILMNPADEEHTAFTTDKGLYCYQVMPFGLKNAGATYQRLVNSMFAEVIGTIMEVYVDDMLVKSLTPEDHVANLSIVFTIILRNGMRLNPQKCIFRVEVGKFLRYIISHRGIEANPEKVQAILDMVSPTYRNEHVEMIVWTAEHEAAFLGLKSNLSEVPLLYKPVPGEMLYLYLVASSTAVSSVLIRKDSDCEYPVYYTGKGYTGAESRYPDIERVALALLKTSGAGILLISPDEQVYEYALKFAFKASNNAAEYEALIAGLQIAQELGVQHLSIFSDSQLVVNQVSGNFEAKEPHMSSYQALARALVQRFTSYIFTQIPRAKKDKADALAKLASTSPNPTYGATRVEILAGPSTSKMVSEIFAVDHTASWMDPILRYMVDDLTPDDKVEARRLQLRVPPIALSILLAPWPFCQWDLDLIGKLPTAVGQFKYAIVAVDYQTKWIEAETLVAITTEKVKSFLWKNIYCRFGVPDTIVTDNGTHFDNDELRAYTQNLGTRILYASPAHPQTNGKKKRGTHDNLANKRRIAHYYDAKVQSRTLKLGNWVMKQVYPEPRGLDPSWTGPYEIIEEVGPATFFIRDMNGVVSKHPWNTQRLRYYYR